MSDERVIIDKGAGGADRIEVSTSELRGKTFLDVRNYYRDKETGEYKPTPKGISVPIHLSKSVWRAIKKVAGPHFDDEPPTEKEKKKSTADRHEKTSELRPKKAKKADTPKKAKRIEVDDEDRPDPPSKKSSGFPSRRRL